MIRRVVNVLGFTRRSLARQTGISDGTLAPLLAYDREPQLKTLRKLLPVLRRAVTPGTAADVVAWTDDPLQYSETPAALPALAAGVTPPSAMEGKSHEEKENVEGVLATQAPAAPATGQDFLIPVVGGREDEEDATDGHGVVHLVSIGDEGAYRRDGESTEGTGVRGSCTEAPVPPLAESESGTGSEDETHPGRDLQRRHFRRLNCEYTDRRLGTLYTCVNLVAEIAAEAREEGFGFCAAMKELARRVSACPSSWGFGYKTKSIRDRLIDEAGLGRGARKLTSDEIGNAEARERYASRFGGPYTLHVADCRRGHGKTRDGGPFRKPHHLEAWVKDYIHDDPQNAAFVQGLFGYLPSVTTMCRWLRAEYGRKAEINRIGNCKPYLQTRGVRGNRIAGYYFELDAAGQPCVFGANEVGSRRDKDNKTHRWVYLARDAESGRIIIGGRGGVSESPGWPDFIEHLLCHELKYAPAVIQSDQVAGLFGQAPELAPGGPCPLSDTALLLLACEVQAVVSQGESPTSKARVERSVGIYRTHADGYFAARQAERDRAIEAGRETRLEAMRYRFIENETAFVLNFLPDVQRRIDEQLINGTGKTALELCSGPASVAWRKTRELVDDPMEVFRRDIQPGIRVGAVGGGVVEWKEKGYSRAFKLTAAEDFKADGSQVCIIIPAGMLKAHTPGRAFIYVIRRGKSNGFTIALAGTCGMILDQYGKGDAQPTILQGFAGKPWDEEARRAFKRDKARRAHTDRQRELIAEARARRDGDVPNIGDFAPSAPLPAVATGTIDAAPLPAGEEGGADGR